MFYYVAKVIITAVIVVLVTEVSKRNTIMGGLLASLPLVSFLAFIWLYIDTKDTERIAELSSQILWLVIPSLVFFALIPIFLKLNIGFVTSMVYASTAMLISYGIAITILK